jgi:hypothetical protein
MGMMMAITKLDQPLNVKSNWGYSVKILAIDPKDQDCFSGEITLPNGTESKNWDLGGLMRDGSDETNLPMGTDAMALLRQFAKQLGAK